VGSEDGGPRQQQSWRERLRGLTRDSRILPTMAPEHVALIAALETVADAVSSTRSTTDVLDSIVLEAKRFTGTEKVAICLVDVEGTTELDRSTLVVRGARAEHREEWWGERLPAIGEWVFSRVEPYFETVPEHNAWLFAAPARVHGEPLGVLIAINSLSHRLREDQVGFLSILASVSAMSIANARLAEESRYALLASERERIAREMHDGIAQQLFSMSLGLEVCRKQVAREPLRVAQALEEMQEILGTSMADLRRYIYDLRPSTLQEHGLKRAIEYWARELAPRGDVRARVEQEGEQRPLPADVESCLYWVARESVTNAVKHSGASEVGVTIAYEPECVRLVIADNGRGFDVEEALSRSERGKQMGLRSFEDRVRRVDGELVIRSGVGQGCVVTATVPD